MSAVGKLTGRIEKRGSLSLLSSIQLSVTKARYSRTRPTGIENKVSLSSPVAQFLVRTAFQWRKLCLSIGMDSPLFKALVFKKFKKAVGGKLRFGLSGGGPLNSEVQEFIRVAFGIDLVQGYVSHKQPEVC